MIRLLVLALLAGPAWAQIQIHPGKDAVEVSSGGARWVLSTSSFDVVHAAVLKGASGSGPGARPCRRSAAT